MLFRSVGLALIGRTEPLEARRATFARIKEPCAGTTEPWAFRPGESAVDQVVVTWFARPSSYTGEDVVEIAGHGTPLLQQRIVELAMSNGARLAEPGEFTLRAYLNGRLDLVQAEAVADLVNAVTPLQARVAMDQLDGTLTSALGEIDAAIFDLCAKLEASLDFPEEGFHFVTRAQAAEDVARIRDSVETLLASGRAGRVVREGRTVVIAGRPNAGKSSLFNALVGAARAIVTEIPGTTRDLLTERVDIGGLDVTLVDTAGLREAENAIEAEGVERARLAQEVAALTLAVIDGSEPYDACVVSGFSRTGTLVVLTKSDLPDRGAARALRDAGGDPIAVSALTGAGLSALRAAIAKALAGQEEWRDTPRISNTRHLALLDDAHAALTRAVGAISDEASEELVLVELGAARQSLEEVTGRRTPDDLLHHIFAKFCVGK